MLNESMSKEQFNGATGGLISIDEDDDINIESQTFQRVWRLVKFIHLFVLNNIIVSD